jgi:hypothetical protein
MDTNRIQAQPQMNADRIYPQITQITAGGLLRETDKQVVPKATVLLTP